MDKYDIVEETKKRVLFLIAHHHTYTDIEGLDYRILIEADFIVNYAEGNFGKKAFMAAYNKYFKTDAGRQLAKQMFEFLMIIGILGNQKQPCPIYKRQSCFYFLV